jgi:hypothetical protein
MQRRARLRQLSDTQPSRKLISAYAAFNSDVQ